MNRALTRGLAGALLLYAALGLVNVLGVPLFRPDDEPRHAAYALRIAEGKLPLVTETVPTDRLGIPPLKTNIMAAANHPPLYYALVGGPILWGSNHHAIPAAMYIARTITLLIGAAGVVYSWLIFRVFAPNDPKLVGLATVLLATFPSFVNYCSLVHNDALAFTSATALFYYLVHALVHGWTPRNKAYFALWAAIVGLTRFSGILVLAPAFVVPLVVPFYHETGSTPQKLWSGVKTSLFAAFAVVATSGWFYARNYQLYGDVTGAAELLDVLHRKTRPGMLYQLVNPKPWGIFHDDLWGRLGGIHALYGSVTVIARTWTAGVVIGLILAANRLRTTDWRASWRNSRVAAYGFGMAGFGAVVLPVFEFYSRGGNIYPRYYFPMLWVVALAAAVGWTSFRSVTATLFSVVTAVVFSAAITDVYLQTLYGVVDQPRDTILQTAMAASGVPAPEFVAGGLFLLGCAGLTLVLTALTDAAPTSRSESP